MTLLGFLLWGFVIFVSQSSALDNGLARTPPMGFMTWQRFRCITDCNLYPDECISEDLVRRQAALMASEGYLEAGYEYIIIDDCWSSKQRDANNQLQPDPDRFPSGISALSEYVHSLGLKFGMYGDFGTYTCGGYPGSIDFLQLDAQTFANWEVDYIKLDGCYASLDIMEDGYVEFGRYLNETGRPIVYSCSWPAYHEDAGIYSNYSLLAETCNLWRNWDDIDDSWSSVTSVLKWFGDNQDRFSDYSAPGHWNDPDMLIIGNFGLSVDQSQAQMAIWAIMAAPLLISVDLKTIRPEFKEILLNKDAIAINQDALGVMGRRVHSDRNIDVWTKPILPIVDGHNTIVVGFISNRSDGHPYRIDVPLSTLGLDAPAGYIIENIFDPENTNLIDGSNLWARVNPSGTVFLRLTPIASVSSS